jgi:hypothetical protein
VADEEARRASALAAKRRYNAKNRELNAQRARDYRAASNAGAEATKRYRKKNPGYYLAWSRANPDKIKAAGLRHHAKHPDARRIGKLKARYGITPEQYAALLEAQGGVCAGCDQPPGDKPLFVDHNHTTGAVRGLLCHGCNASLGLLGEDVERIASLLRYIWFPPASEGIGLSTHPIAGTADTTNRHTGSSHEADRWLHDASPTTYPVGA